MEPARNGRDDPPGPVVPRAVPAAAMEPARNGRDDEDEDVRVAGQQGAAMEPARNGRDDSASRACPTGRSRPQWSPPVMGGMTGAACRPVTRTPIAAMEPARNGRDDPQDRDPGGRLAPAAAMEPARNGRDDMFACRYQKSRATAPQWSPPVMGGMTSCHILCPTNGSPRRNGARP